MGRYFGTDGIRGKAYDWITPELAYSVGRSLALLVNPLLVIARDTRESGPMIVEALTKGALESGISVINYDVLPTPVLCYQSEIKHALGVMVTASHNPYKDNGIKVFANGKKLFPEQEDLLEQVISGTVDLTKPLRSGRIREADDPIPSYLALMDSFAPVITRKVVIDLANGATMRTAKHVFQDRIKDAVFIGHHPNGKNINLGVGSTHMEKIQEYVRNNGCDIGFAFDGDGDRVLCVNREGSLIDGDRMIYLLACALKDQGMLSHNTVVLTKMSNLGIIKALKHKGIDCIETPVGDKYVLEAMDQGGYVLGGENSGHIINRSYLSTGDGVLNALAILSLLEQKSQSIDDLLEPVHLYPETLSNLRGYDPAVLKRESVKKIILDLTHALGSEGKILVRPSGTEPLIRILVSAQTQAQVDHAIHSIETAIKAESQINTSPL